MQQIEADARKGDRRCQSFGPFLITCLKRFLTCLYSWVIFPLPNRLLLKLNPDPLTADFTGRQPVGQKTKRGILHSNIELPLEIWGLGLNPGKADLGPYFAQLTNQDHSLDNIGQSVNRCGPTRKEDLFSFRDLAEHLLRTGN